MESKIIKTLLLVSFLFFNASIVLKAQSSDSRRFTTDCGFGFLPISISGILEKSVGGQFIDNYEVPYAPTFYYKDTLGMAANFTVHAGYVFPLYSNSKWSTGIKVNVGGGIQANIRATEGLKGYFLDFPQYIYYRNFAGKLDYEFNLGYKYTYSGLPYQLIIGSADLYLREDWSLALYGSINKYTYFMYFTDGREVPMVQYREFGFKITQHF